MMHGRALDRSPVDRMRAPWIPHGRTDWLAVLGIVAGLCLRGVCSESLCGEHARQDKDGLDGSGHRRLRSIALGYSRKPAAARVRRNAEVETVKTAETSLWVIALS